MICLTNNLDGLQTCKIFDRSGENHNMYHNPLFQENIEKVKTTWYRNH